MERCLTHHQDNCRECRGLPAATTQGDNMGKLKKALESKVEFEDTKLTTIDDRIHILEVERSFHVGLRTAYVNALAELF